MKKLSITIISVISLCCIVACSSANTDEGQSTEIDIVTEQEVEKQVTVEDLQTSEEEGLTNDAKQKIEELGGTVNGKMIVTYFDYPDRIIYNSFIMCGANKAEFYTDVFYYTDEAYKTEMMNENHYGEIKESNDKMRYIRTFIETIEDTNYEKLYEEEKDYGILVE